MGVKFTLTTWGYIGLAAIAAGGLVATALYSEVLRDSKGSQSDDLVEGRGLRSLRGLYHTELNVVADFDSRPMMAPSSPMAAQDVKTQGLTSRLTADIMFMPWSDGMDVTFSHVTVEVGGVVDTRLSAEMSKTRAVLRTTPSGTLREVGVSEGVSTQTIAILSQLLAQLPTSVSMDGSQGDVTEQDVFGRYQTQYSWQDSSHVLTRTKVKYLQLDPVSFGEGSVGTVEPGQSWQASFDHEGLRAIHGDETLLVTKHGQKVLRQTLSFRSIRTKETPPPATRTTETLTWLPYKPGFVTEYRDPKLLEQIYKQELGSVTEAQILGALPTISTQELEVEWYRKVRAFIYSHPERTEAFIPLLQDAALDSVTMRIVAPALGRIGHKEAQETLRRVMGIRLEVGRPSAPLFPLLVQSASPTPETIQFVRQAVSSDNPVTRTSALLAYGKLAATTRDVDPDRSAHIVSELRRMLVAERHPDLLRTLIFAAGNSESQEFLEDLVAIIDRTSDPAIKGHSIEAIGSLDGEQPLAILKAYLRSTDDQLQTHALIGLANQPYDPQLAGEIHQMVETHPSREVRIAALDWVFRQRLHMETAADIFRKVREQDPDHEVRKRAASILSVL